MCGEKSFGTAQRIRGRGSPPRVRGKADPKKHRTRQAGITPACAGKRFSGLLRKAGKWDHPRVCGEKRIKNASGSKDIGSPPRVRGKVPRFLNQPLSSGITPACAGKSSASSSSVHRSRDHPRVCGEKYQKHIDMLQATGSPPRVRGKGRRRPRRFLRQGITPACAGKSGMNFPRRLLLRDHPRVCGEKGTGLEPFKGSMGSPPRVRGKVCSLQFF